MTGKSKIFIGCGIAFLIPVLALIGLVVYIGSDKEYTAPYEVAIKEGTEYGQTTDQKGCLQQGILRMKDVKEPSITQLSVNSRFVKECLRASKPSPNFCQDVPKVFVRDWINNQCKLIGKNGDPVCYLVYDEQTTFCAGL